MSRAAAFKELFLVTPEAVGDIVDIPTPALGFALLVMDVRRAIGNLLLRQAGGGVRRRRGLWSGCRLSLWRGLTSGFIALNQFLP